MHWWQYLPSIVVEYGIIFAIAPPTLSMPARLHTRGGDVVSYGKWQKICTKFKKWYLWEKIKCYNNIIGTVDKTKLPFMTLITPVILHSFFTVLCISFKIISSNCSWISVLQLRLCGNRIAAYCSLARLTVISSGRGSSCFMSEASTGANPVFHTTGIIHLWISLTAKAEVPSQKWRYFCYIFELIGLWGEGTPES